MDSPSQQQEGGINQIPRLAQPPPVTYAVGKLSSAWAREEIDTKYLKRSGTIGGMKSTSGL